MFREMLKSKIHRVRVTQADLHYVGSLTIDRTLMERADLLAGEKIDVLDITNGARLSTYVIEGPADSGVIGINGAAAHLVGVGDLVIILSYVVVPDDKARTLQPSVVLVDDDNRPLSVGHDPADAPNGLMRGDVVVGEGLR
ncbi:aspartate 1-decarboxylase [Micromonospora sp. CPCC 205371]|nr:aspartate 1-decarboxylase [Micromonospora sp. CPCC 205371]